MSPSRQPRHESPPLRGLPDRLWDHPETAAFLGIPPATLHQMNSRGVGPRSYRVGRYRRYDPRDVEAWLQERASLPRSA